MIPDLPNLSNPVMPDSIVNPYNRIKAPLVDYARGGVALLDSSKGINVKYWRCEMQEGDVYLSAKDVNPFKVETFIGKPDWISFAFDQNMHYNLAYTLQGSGAFLYWYDAEQQRYVTESLGSVRTPFLRMDDSRDEAFGYNDMILSYIKGFSLCVRIQRDRFKQEYVLVENAGSAIIQCGMNKKLRFQWETT